ncbi:hypothetical protein SAMN05443575_1987 [Jatrophihabitans endophyticus]|uniref:Bacterial Ig-like domain-containing protein n=1 Tax=Jatrophihabitans endophyticus TaxID=1206085 RepID=A0A1M5IS10_9ACTN|nr:hypothetical protein [Jatrophihabitans endophyticus]SHG31132.1 hypothetical protein SAMN05443575_1987 [Jatrophihabitans endophyticus]
MSRLSRAILIVASLAAAAVVVPATDSVAGVSRHGPTSFLTVAGAAGEPITQGKVWTFDDTDGLLQFSGNEGRLTWRLSTRYGDGNTDYEVELAAPVGGQLTTGTYTNVARAGFNGTHAGLSVSGQGRACNTLTGSVLIRSITTNQFGGVTELDASFTQYCDGSKVPLNGSLQYHAPVRHAVTLTSSHPVTVLGQPTTLTAQVHRGSSVFFYDGTKRIGRAKADSFGLARLTTATLKAGTHQLTARRGKHSSVRVRQRVDGSATSFWFRSVGGDGLATGATAAYTPTSSQMPISATTRKITVDVGGDASWDVVVQSPTRTALRPGTYEHTQQGPTATSAGVMMYGGGNACDTQSGSLHVSSLRANKRGVITAVALSFAVYCNGSAYPLRGTLHYTAA